MAIAAPATLRYNERRRDACRLAQPESMTEDFSTRRAIVIGGGPAGLMAAEVLAAAGLRVDLYDAMPSVGRKFLLAGKGGLNLTHAEPFAAFASRYGTRSANLRPQLSAFGPDALRAWALGLGVETIVGTSQRVFPRDLKAAPLLRAWLKRLRECGVHLHMRHRWLGWTADNALRFATPDGEQTAQADVVILALGGGSWAKLGADGAWVPVLGQRGVDVRPLRPSNCGFEIAWSAHLRARWAGQPLKPVAARWGGNAAEPFRQGEFIITATGVEGSLIYALSAQLRDIIDRDGSAILELDLAPTMPLARLTEKLTRPRGAQSLSKHLHRAGIDGVKSALLHEVLTKADFADPQKLAHAIKHLPLRLAAARPLDEAISSAGGVAFDALTENAMLAAVPGLFCAGEMLDWEAPTGGYLLTACFATGRAAAQGALAWLRAGNHIASP